MARKWLLLFYKLQSLLRHKGAFVLIGVLASIAAIGFHMLLPAIASERQIRPFEAYRVRIAHLTIDLASDPIIRASYKQTSEELLKEGISFYQSGRYSDAAASWNRALGQLSGNSRYRALTWNYLALAYGQLSRLQEAEQAIQRCFQLLANVPEPEPILARALTSQGRLQLWRGNAETALEVLERAEAIYKELGDSEGVRRSQINQAQALQALGLHRRALKTFLQVRQVLAGEPDSPAKATALLSLGNTLQAVGDLERSWCTLEEGWQVVRDKPLPSYASIAGDLRLSLGNTTRAISQRNRELQAQTDLKVSVVCPDDKEKPLYGNALEFYRQVANSPDARPITKVQAKLNELSLLLEMKQIVKAKSLRLEIQAQIDELPASRAAIYARINFARSLMRLDRVTEVLEPTLVAGIKKAKELGDERAETYALGYLGQLYEKRGDLAQALATTEQALEKAEAIDAPDLTYQWQWQLGRILKARGDREGAIARYEQAVNLLQMVRQNLTAIGFGLDIDADIHFYFRERVEPVYREFVELLLEPAGNESDRQEDIKTALTVMELLQIAELENFLQCELGEDRSVSQAKGLQDAREAIAQNLAQIHKADPRAAVIYPIVLPERLETIISLPGQPLRHYSTPINEQKVKEAIDKLDRLLRDRPGKFREVQGLSGKIYQWLIRPLEDNGQLNGVETLVFGLDTLLRKVPMSVLYDGDRYLVESYDIAIAPSLQLQESQSFAKKPEVLAAGLSEATLGFTGLPNVKKELAEIAKVVPSKSLLDRDFTTESLGDRIEFDSFPVLHLATHGQFSSQLAQTFVLAWDKQIDINEFAELVRSRARLGSEEPIELLVLSGCETAEGDRRAALGLAGVALRAGARSTIGSLWSVGDESTAALMSQFYKELFENGETRAKALSKAQRFLLQLPERSEYKKPHYWAPFVLVGSWF